MTPPERQKELLRRLAEQTITMIQFLEECYHWALDIECQVDYEVRLYPQPPNSWIEYEALPFEKRWKTDQSFFHQPDIKAYNFQKGKVYAENYSDYMWLNEIKKHIPVTPDVEDKIYSLKLWLKNSTKELESLATTFEGRVI